jgi:hypothetical protein
MKTRILGITIVFFFFSSLVLADTKNTSVVKNTSKTNQKTTKTLTAKEPLTSDSVAKLLEKTVDLSQFKTDLPFEKAVDILRHSTNPPVNIIVLWIQLGQADIERSSPINMDAITNVPLKTGLNMLLESISSTDKKLGYYIKNGQVVIGLEDLITRQKETRIYNVTDILSSPANYYPMNGGGMMQQNMGYGNQQNFGSTNNSGFGQNRAGSGSSYSQYGMGRGMSSGYGMQTGMMGTGTGMGMGGMGTGGMGMGGMGMGGMGMGGMGMGGGGMGMGGMGIMDNPAMQYYRQQQLSGLIKNTVQPDSWNRP